ncbi:hypothetical protein IGB42_01600 [Andreprevotia sp. IGB-42]|uniref:hypothetical protein n=1 Tax=Andreprevotia sp. IGB-42 TaxID=2497473 RepID=UPI0013570D6D|nr:hypothetical protein [Andreprevotia sp. IGB-42]KAF0813921.1 hypothetical protein IGB42_01600 [Andreprevotia sp. IGB-42]
MSIIAELIQAFDTKNSYLIVMAIVLLVALPIIRSLREWLTGRHAVRKEKLAALCDAINAHDQSSYPQSAAVRFRLEQQFAQYFKKTLTFWEISTLLNHPNPTRALKLYLGTQPYLTQRVYGDKPGRFRFKSRHRRLRLRIYKWYFNGYRVTAFHFGGYMLFAAMGFAIMWLLPLLFKHAPLNIAVAGLVLCVSLISYAVQLLISGLSFVGAVQFMRDAQKIQRHRRAELSLLPVETTTPFRGSDSLVENSITAEYAPHLIALPPLQTTDH